MVVLGPSSPLKPGDTWRCSIPSSRLPVIFWEGHAGVSRGFTLFHPLRKTQGMGRRRGETSFPCSITASPPWMEETDTDGKHRFSQGFSWERAAPRGERRGILGLRIQLPSQRLSEVSALQPGALPAHPSPQPFPVRRCLHPPSPLLCPPPPPELGGYLGALSTPKSAATQLTPLDLCSTEPPLMGPHSSITSEPRSHAASRCGSGSLGHRRGRSPPPRAQIHPRASHREAG